jgi:phospholipid-binding lipoprotein MlaA
LTSDRSKSRDKASAPSGLGLGLGLALAATVWTASAQAQQQPPVVQAPPAASTNPNDGDPWRGLNRASFALSMGLDKVLIGPVTHVYMAIVPSVVRDRVSSAVYNLGEPNTAMNLALQGHGKAAARSGTRFVVNSTVGVLGLFDVAAKTGLKRREADFGQTFGRYGAGPGPYVYVPVMGPSNVRDGTGRVLDFVTDPLGIAFGGVESKFGRARLGVTILDTRAVYDSAFRALDDTIDPYAATRSAGQQRREAFVREATGEVQALPDFDDAEAAAPTPSTTPQAQPAQAGPK